LKKRKLFFDRMTVVKNGNFAHLRAQRRKNAMKRKNEKDGGKQEHQNEDNRPERIPKIRKKKAEQGERQKESAFNNKQNQSLIDVKKKKSRALSFSLKDKRQKQDKRQVGKGGQQCFGA
jgi:hypothetical protein